MLATAHMTQNAQTLAVQSEVEFHERFAGRHVSPNMRPAWLHVAQRQPLKQSRTPLTRCPTHCLAQGGGYANIRLLWPAQSS